MAEWRTVFDWFRSGRIQARYAVNADDQAWMTYVESEVIAVCKAKGWGHQIRRKWSVREKPVRKSTIDDFEWKLIPAGHGKLPDAPAGDFEGVYYVVSVDRSDGRFVLQHDTSHCGIMGPHWEEATYTEIRQNLILATRSAAEHHVPPDYPPPGWLRDHLLRLITRFQPNSFSVT